MVNPLIKAVGQAARKPIKKGAEEAISKAAESAGMKAPVVAQKDLTTLQDSYTSLGDRIRMEAELKRKMMEGFDYKYDKGQRVFTEDSAAKNKAPYEILFRTRTGNQVMREDHPTLGPGLGRPIIDPETGRARRTPYEPGYRVRSLSDEGEVYEFEIPASAIKGDVEMARGGKVYISSNPDTMRMELEERKFDKGGAAFGVFPQMKPRRAGRTDNADEAMFRGLARGFAAGATGAPGDAELIARLLANTPGVQAYGEATGAATPGKYRQGEVGLETRLPTSEDMEKRIPFRQENPSALERAATGLGQIGGGFYTGPGAPIRAVTAIPSAVARAGRDFVMAAGQPAVSVVKPTRGGNWKAGDVEKVVQDYLKRAGFRGDSDPADLLKQMREQYPPEVIAKLETPESAAHVNRVISDLEQKVAINNWVDRNLTNYIKKEMGTPDDPVRKMAEEGATHLSPANTIPAAPNAIVKSVVDLKRQRAGMPEPMGKSPAAVQWEARTDYPIKTQTVGELKQYGLDEPWMDKVDPSTPVYSLESFSSTNRVPDNPLAALRIDHMLDVLREDLASGRIRPDQLNKVSMEQAVRRTAEYDKELADKMQAASAAAREGLPVYKEYPEGYRWIELNRPGAFAAESEAMGHSVRGYEPPKGHPDWIEGSGGQGSLGYGHGGWEAIKSGEAKVYSLVDPKGQPHVTVEVSQVDDVPSISQIKGKQNAAPSAEYLPYVQDFVRSGKWEDVRDLRNAGFDYPAVGPSGIFDLTQAEKLRKSGVEVPNYLTRDEADSLKDTLYRLETGKDPVTGLPIEGKAHGGRVHISDNPDTMRLELEDKQMAGGGVAKALKEALKPLPRAAAKTKPEIEAIAERMAPQVLSEYVREKPKSAVTVAGKTRKQFEREKELPVDVRGEVKTPETVDVEKLKGNVVIGIPGDPTITDRALHAVGDVRLESASPQHGGPLYGLGRPEFWASGIGPATRVQNLAAEVAQQYGAPVLGKYVMMGPESINYAQHFADANLQAINLSKMTQAQIDGFNDLIRRGSPKSGPRPSFPGIEDTGAAYLHFSVDPELRKHFNALMQQPKVTEAFNLPSGQDIRFAITEPALRDLETGVTGFSLGRMKPREGLKLSEHPTYSHDIPGEFMGQSRYPMPYELSFPDTLAAVRANPAQAPQEFGSLKMVGPRQIIDQQMIDEIKIYEEAMKRLTGKKKGGVVKLAAGGLSKAAVEALTKMRSLSKEFAEKSAEHARYIQETKNVPTKQLPSFEEWKALQMNATPENIEQLRKETGNKRGGSIKKKR